MPGIAGAETIYGSHAKVVDHPNQVGRIRDNPIRKEIEESGSMAGLNFLINTVLNEQGDICRIVCGHPGSVFQKGIELFNRLYRFEISEPFDLLIVGSNPMDMDFYQANKAITASSLGVRDGGAIILASPCWNGISPFPYFDEMIMSGKDFKQWRNLIRSSDLKHKVAAEICLALRSLRDLRKITIGLVSPGIHHGRIAKMGLIPYASIEEAFEDMMHRVGDCHRIGIVPKGPVTHMVNPR
jgi:nickel-dependent lactate racemase